MKSDPAGFNLWLAIYVLNGEAGQLKTKAGIMMGRQEEAELCKFSFFLSAFFFFKTFQI